MARSARMHPFVLMLSGVSSRCQVDRSSLVAGLSLSQLATTHAGFCGFPELQIWNVVQQLPRLSLDSLSVNHVAGVVEGDRDLEGLQSPEEVFAQAAFRQKFVNIQNGETEGGITTPQKLPIGLHRVAAAGSCHQNRIEISFDRVEAAHQG